LKIKIFDVDGEDCEKEREFWEKIEGQNGLTKNSLQGMVMHKSTKGKFQRMSIIAEVDTLVLTQKEMLANGKIKIGWNICKVQEYIEILRCFKCCGYYHFGIRIVKKIYLVGNVWEIMQQRNVRVK